MLINIKIHDFNLPHVVVFKSCSGKGIIVTAYVDKPPGTLTLTKDGSGKFTEVFLNPKATVEGNISKEILQGKHQKAHTICFIANSVNFPVKFGKIS